MKCLEKDRNRRYETANDLARDIERYLHDEPVQACPPRPAIAFESLPGETGRYWPPVERSPQGWWWASGYRPFCSSVKRAAARIALANEARAELEAAKSQQVAEFMTDMLKGVGPSVALGRYNHAPGDFGPNRHALKGPAGSTRGGG